MPVAKSKSTVVAVSPPNIRAIKVRLTGDAPYMMARFSKKAMDAMAAKMDGTTKKGSRTARGARDFDDDYEQAKHLATEGWIGMPASGLRAALISACRLTGFVMTRAKLSIFVRAEGFDSIDGQGLIRIYGEPEPNRAAVRNQTGVFDLRVRPMWKEWYVEPVIQYDADQFSLEDVLNLLRRVGMQVGLGEGRPDSRNSAGLGLGTFEVSSTGEEITTQ